MAVDNSCRCAPIDNHISKANYIVVYSVRVFLTNHLPSNVEVFEKVFFWALKDAPDMVNSAPTGLAARLVEPNPVLLHTTSTGDASTARLKCTNLIGKSLAWRVNEWAIHALVKMNMPGFGTKLII